MIVEVGERGGGVYRGDSPVEAQILRDRTEAARVERGLQRPILRQDRRGRLRPDTRRPGQLVGRVAAQRDEVGHLLRVDAVAVAYLRRADPLDLRDAPLRHEQRRVLARELEEVAV